jgi:PTH1 family peptidyl-tRNA hydrolase
VWLVVGLGNPGRRYEATRHNVGFRVVERLAERWGFPVDAKDLFGAKVGEGQVRNTRVLVARPQGFMNLSGQPVISIAGFHKLGPDRVVVVHDDLDLPVGDVRCKVGGGHGGHNGLRDIIRVIGGDFLRVRYGIGRPPEGWEVADFVLGKWGPEEAALLGPGVERAADVIEVVLTEGAAAAMNQFNVRSGGPRPAAPGGAASARPAQSSSGR